MLYHYCYLEKLYQLSSNNFLIHSSEIPNTYFSRNYDLAHPVYKSFGNEFAQNGNLYQVRICIDDLIISSLKFNSDNSAFILPYIRQIDIMNGDPNEDVKFKDKIINQLNDLKIPFSYGRKWQPIAERWDHTQELFVLDI